MRAFLDGVQEAVGSPLSNVKRRQSAADVLQVRSRHLLIGVLVIAIDAPILGILVLVGVKWGWRASVGALVYVASFPVLTALRKRWPPRTGPLSATAEFVVFSVVAGSLGWFFFRGLGAIFGAAFGFVARLAEIPIKPRKPRRGDSSRGCHR